MAWFCCGLPSKPSKRASVLTIVRMGGAINVNLWWGWELDAFGIIMLLPGRRSYCWLFREVDTSMIPVKVQSGVDGQ